MPKFGPENAEFFLKKNYLRTFKFVKNGFSTHTVVFGVGSTFYKGLGSTFFKGLDPGLGPLYKLWLMILSDTVVANEKIFSLNVG